MNQSLGARELGPTVSRLVGCIEAVWISLAHSSKGKITCSSGLLMISQTQKHVEVGHTLYSLLAFYYSELSRVSMDKDNHIKKKHSKKWYVMCTFHVRSPKPRHQLLIRIKEGRAATQSQA